MRSILSSGVPTATPNRRARLGIRGSGREAVVGARHQHAVGLLEDIVERVGNFGEIGQARKGGLGQRERTR